MTTTEHDKLSDHEYDGIQEYDNPTPGWWVLVFVLTIAFSIVYFVYYHSQQPERSVYDAYAAAKTADIKKRFAKMGDLKADQASLLAYMANPDYLTAGHDVFRANCVSCHGSEAQGLVGPNLTDEYAKNIKTLEDLPRIISNGAGNGAMPAWKLRGMENNDIVLVAAYVASLRGQNLPGPRGAEGEKMPDWPKPPTKDKP